MIKKQILERIMDYISKNPNHLEAHQIEFLKKLKVFYAEKGYFSKKQENILCNYFAIALEQPEHLDLVVNLK